MADIPEGPKPNRDEEEYSQLMGNVSQKKLLTSSAPGSQHPDQFNPAGMSLDVPSVTVLTAASSGEHSSPVSATLSPLDIDRLIRSCDLKSEEITSLMAEEVPSSDSEDSYGSFTTLKLVNKAVPQFSEEDDEKIAYQLAGKVKLDESTMTSWLVDGSDDSAMSSCREPLIPLDDESDMEEFSNSKENVKSDTKVNNDKEEPFVDDLINLMESQEKILEQAPNQTVVASKSLLDIENESVSNYTAVANKSLLDIEIETAPKQTAVASKSLLDIEIETSQNPRAVANKSLLDIETDETSPEGKQDSNSETEKCARVCVEHIKGVLSDVLKEVKKPDPNPAAINIDVENGNGLKTLEEELREEAEANTPKRKVSHWDAEIGLSKINVPELLRIVKNESFKRNIKKIWVCNNTFQTSSNDLNDGNELKKGDDELFQPDKADEVPQETFHETDSDEYIDVVSVEETSPLNNVEEHTLHHATAAEMETKDSAETNIAYESLKEGNIPEKTEEDASSEKPTENKVETDDVVKEQKSAMIKSILKKHVTFVSNGGHPGMEHMALHHEESKIEERQLDMDTPLRFMTETYPSHEDEEMLSESLNATLEPCALSRSRRGSPLAAELYEELKILEGDEQQKTLSVSPCQSPERSEFPESATKDNKTITNKPGSKFSKFFKSVKKKIWS
ncbi:hypothetical protein AVEN_34711-1 [Araneus ventricosus]|uniref:Uncharacterized protein n=1 Tax=Araneus ventricosus TaxID=182803 RepID=A0A4Y2AZP9_ARAVE|nr:hypothetical protein AVEN_34711-1 [Araneus ventricosus]